MTNEAYVLVVEDHRPLLMAVRDILESEGYSVLTAMDGVEALELMEENRPDLIIADIMMPRMDGYALYKSVRARPEWLAIPFIFLTARAEREDILKGKDLGAEDYITKPFDPQNLVVTVRSRLRRAEDIREATQVEFNNLKQQIITVLSHELRTPLTYVSGYTDLALEESADLDPQAFQNFLLGIKRGADRLTQLVEDLLFLVYLDTGRAAEEFHMLARVHRDVNLLVEHVVNSHEEQAAAQGVRLKLDLAGELAPVQLYETYLIDALGRLVDNGIKFCKKDGHVVTVSTRRVDDWVEVSVVDDGIGIPEADLPFLFERFQQVGRERMEQQGAGVGLTIAKELICLHDGDIAVESEVGAGSTFTVRLPVVQEGDT
jgi:signal transduction histidine kinase